MFQVLYFWKPPKWLTKWCKKIHWTCKEMMETLKTKAPTTYTRYHISWCCIRAIGSSLCLHLSINSVLTRVRLGALQVSGRWKQGHQRFWEKHWYCIEWVGTQKAARKSSLGSHQSILWYHRGATELFMLKSQRKASLHRLINPAIQRRLHWFLYLKSAPEVSGTMAT